MVRSNEAYPSIWFSADPDLMKDGEWIERKLVISFAEWGEFGASSGEVRKKRVFSFVGEKKKLGVSGPNHRNIAKFLGLDDDDDWMGATVVLYANMELCYGEMKPVIRVRNAYMPGRTDYPDPVNVTSAADQGNQRFDPGLPMQPQTPAPIAVPVQQPPEAIPMTDQISAIKERYKQAYPDRECGRDFYQWCNVITQSPSDLTYTGSWTQSHVATVMGVLNAPMK